ncbi:MAG: hypothetical protein ACRBCK_12035 [Alphaproteobacteria bacterium]
MAKKKKQVSVTQKRRLEMRAKLWKDAEDKIWSPTGGWLIIPRAMPLILRIMDIASPNGKPVSQTYMDLWCRNREDDGFVIASNPKEMAYYSGFTGERAESTWTTRMRILEDLGFVEFKEGTSGPIHYVLLHNPYEVIEALHAKKEVPNAAYNALIEKIIEIGEKSLDEDE